MKVHPLHKSRGAACTASTRALRGGGAEGQPRSPQEGLEEARAGRSSGSRKGSGFWSSIPWTPRAQGASLDRLALHILLLHPVVVQLGDTHVLLGRLGTSFIEGKAGLRGLRNGEHSDSPHGPSLMPGSEQQGARHPPHHSCVRTPLAGLRLHEGELGFHQLCSTKGSSPAPTVPTVPSPGREGCLRQL